QDCPCRRRRMRSVARCGNHNANILCPMVFPPFPEAAFGGVPFEDEFARERIPALADADDEGRRADGMDERAGKRRSWPGPRRRNDKPERRRGRFGKSRLAQEEEGPPGLKRAPVQASCRGEVEPARVPSDFEEYRRKGLQPRRLLGDPERILELAGPGEKDGFRADAETLMKARKIGEARFAEDVRRADPEERPVRSLLHEKARQSQGEAGYRSGVARLPAMQLDKAGAWPSAAENPVERISSRAQKGRASSCGRHAVVACEDAV